MVPICFYITNTLQICPSVSYQATKARQENAHYDEWCGADEGYKLGRRSGK